MKAPATGLYFYSFFIIFVQATVYCKVSLNMKTILLLLPALLLGGFLSAQSLMLNGNIVINETTPEGTRLIITKNGEQIDTQTLNRKGHFDLKLALGADYKLSFEKAGYITKIVNVNTEVPEEILESNPNFPPVKLIINLLPMVSGVDLTIFEQPIAILAYNPELDDFTFDKDYSGRIKTKVAQTEQEIRRKANEQSKASLEKERRFAELISKGQQSYDRKEWAAAITAWTEALQIKPAEEEVKRKITAARQEAELDEARRSIELQNAQTYKMLIASADSLFKLKHYEPSREKYLAAAKLKPQENYPEAKIKEIDSLLGALAREEAETQKRLAATEAEYQKTISMAEQAFNAQKYTDAINSFQQALALKPQETYPAEMITKATAAIADIQKKQAEEAEHQRIETEKRNARRNKYDILIAEADAAFKNFNYSLARLRYVEADELQIGEPYPKKQIQAIDNIINSSKYKNQLAEYNKNKTLAEKNREAKNYASAKVYYQKALGILPIDKDDINSKLAEIEKLIETEQLAAIEKEYQTHISKADKAFHEKAYAVAKYYYQKALEVKINDKYAAAQLREVEKNIGERQEKEAEL